jgi:Na+-transporting methylmalonyl-CoA/oxaloacetate decarboxylase gamma subunit
MLLLSEIFDFSVIDENALIIAFVGWTIVLIALILLFLIFNNLPALIYYKSRKEQRKERKAAIKNADAEHPAIEIQQEVSGELNAAISMALYMYFNDLHDEESNVLTIKHSCKTASPWGSKVHGVMQNQLTKQ